MSNDNRHSAHRTHTRHTRLRVLLAGLVLALVVAITTGQPIDIGLLFVLELAAKIAYAPTKGHTKPMKDHPKTRISSHNRHSAYCPHPLF